MRCDLPSWMTVFNWRVNVGKWECNCKKKKHHFCSFHGIFCTASSKDEIWEIWEKKSKNSFPFLSQRALAKHFSPLILLSYKKIILMLWYVKNFHSALLLSVTKIIGLILNFSQSENWKTKIAVEKMKRNASFYQNWVDILFLSL